ncbi:MAG: hypothetical protein ACQEUM_06715 [Pseudomonadota bacterium]
MEAAGIELENLAGAALFAEIHQAAAVPQPLAGLGAIESALLATPHWQRAP